MTAKPPERSGPMLYTNHGATCAALTKPFIENHPCDCGLRERETVELRKEVFQLEEERDALREMLRSVPRLPSLIHLPPEAGALAMKTWADCYFAWQDSLDASGLSR